MLKKDFQDQENLIKEIKELAFDFNRWQEYECFYRWQEYECISSRQIVQNRKFDVM